MLNSNINSNNLARFQINQNAEQFKNQAIKMNKENFLKNTNYDETKFYYSK